MTNIQINSVFARLSEASYAKLWDAEHHLAIVDSGDVEAALKNTEDGNNFSATQAAEFVTHWRVVDHQPETTSGFSATLFQRIDTDPESGLKAGDYVFAIRGTKDRADVAADFGDIGGDGIAIAQGVDLLNFLNRLTVRAGDPLYEYDISESYLPFALFRIPIGILGSVSVTQSGVATQDGLLAGKPFAVSGHSLGGHLALIASRLKPAQVTDVYTYNAPGFDTGLSLMANTERFFNALATEQAGLPGGREVRLGGFDTTNFHNYANPFDIISRIGDVPGGLHPLFSETTDALSDRLAAHSIVGVSDVLAVQALLAGLDVIPNGSVSELNAQLDKLGSILSASSHKPEESLESLLDALGALFGIPAKLDIDQREPLYQRIAEIRGSAGYTQMQGDSEVFDLSNIDASTLATLARTDIAFRHALFNLLPFTLGGFASDAIYQQHNAHGELNLYDPTNGTGEITDSWLNDRAYVLRRLIERNLADTQNASESDATNEVYEDLGTTIRFATNDLELTGVTRPASATQYVFGGKDDDPIDGGQLGDHLYGGLGDDTLRGNDGGDYLEGNGGVDMLYGDAGEDTLVGGAGDDRLRGGYGNDTYIAGNGDVIRDDDGIGSVTSRGNWPVHESVAA